MENTPNALPLSDGGTGGPLLSSMELQDLRSAFDLIDIEGKGIIRVQDLLDVLGELDSEHFSRPDGAKSNITRLMDRLSTWTGDMSLSFEDFTALCTSPHPDKREALKKVFDQFDAAGKGFIDMDDLKKVALDLGETSMKDEELREMLQRTADPGKASYEDFSEIMNKNLFS